MSNHRIWTSWDYDRLGHVGPFTIVPILTGIGGGWSVRTIRECGGCIATEAALTQMPYA
ncbi:hypothetical protein OH76DRAFT_1394943 [Lentinus brumalis]|uniref:Uncharacterized protein n=1 Tax=Lentinus brumalis TaxID=2498619 RepID=A0A371DXC8_9APHY|nr:hypothetical protein OH76DRAFT_1394943 [Polyporus brumalis]